MSNAATEAATRRLRSVMVEPATHDDLSEIRVAMQRIAGHNITMGEVVAELVALYRKEGPR